MIDGQISNPPESYLKVILPLIDVTREILEKGEDIEPIAFVGNFLTGAIAQVLLENENEVEKDRSAEAIRLAAGMIESDFVFVIMEAWSLRKDKVAQMDAILDKYGSIGASPYRVDVVSFALETRHGLWISQCEIKPKGISKKKRCIDTPAFQFFREAKGRFTHLLKENADGETASTLH